MFFESIHDYKRNELSSYVNLNIDEDGNEKLPKETK